MIDLSWITPALSVGASFACEDVEELAREHRVMGVIDVRFEACDDEALLVARGIELLHLPTHDHCAIAPELLCRGVAFAARHIDGGRRVLIHCEHGIGRSALLALCVLVERGLAPLAALELAKSRRDKISPSPAQYEAWGMWLRDRGHEPPAFGAFAAIAYRHLRRR